MREDQYTIQEWVKTAFPCFDTLDARVHAILEESIELAVASGWDADRIMKTIELVLDRVAQQAHDPGGEKGEIADLIISAYAFASQQKFDAHEEVDKKMTTNRSRPLSYYRDKIATKKQILGASIPTE